MKAFSSVVLSMRRWFSNGENDVSVFCFLLLALGGSFFLGSVCVVVVARTEKCP